MNPSDVLRGILLCKCDLQGKQNSATPLKKIQTASNGLTGSIWNLFNPKKKKIYCLTENIWILFTQKQKYIGWTLIASSEIQTEGLKQQDLKLQC